MKVVIKMRLLKICFTTFILFVGQASFCQNLSRLDSLKRALREAPPLDHKVDVLLKIVNASASPDSIIKYSGLLLENAGEASNKLALLKGYRFRGMAWRRLSEFDHALEDLFKSAQIAEELDLAQEVGNSNVEIGNAYSESGSNELAAVYYDRGLKALRKTGNNLSIGGALYNIGDGLYDKKQFDSSLSYTLEARDIFRDAEQPVYEAYAIGNLGRIYLQKGELENVKEYLQKSIEVLEKVPDYNALTDYYYAMGDYYRIEGNYAIAIDYAHKSLDAARHDNMGVDQVEAYLLLSDLYQEIGDIKSSLDHYKMHVLLKDSINNLSTVRRMANLRTGFEIAKKQKEVDLLHQQKRNQKTIVISTIVALVLIGLLAFGLYRRNKFIGRTKKIIENEKNRSELLLLNILPQETASELKENGKVEAKRFDAVSILFTDFKNFTHYAESLSPEELVKSVDFYFTEFDNIMEKYGLEKIKTLGDSYMCAAGVPFPVEDHAVKIVGAACEMMDFVNRTRQLVSQNETRFEMRIGINSGPVIAGVVGSKKFAYDIWGDAVNIASRMESTGQIGLINISEFTYELVKDHFDCNYRGEIQVKNKGVMKMYYVNCTSPGSSSGLNPN